MIPYHDCQFISEPAGEVQALKNDPVNHFSEAARLSRG
jgi:hypothetical protein